MVMYSEGTATDLFVGLDVSVRTTSVCVMDGPGKVLKEAKVESEPSATATLLGNFDGHYRRAGLEEGPLSQWLYSGLASLGYPVISLEKQHMKAALSAQIDKTDRNDPDAADGAEVPAIADHPSTPRTTSAGCCAISA